MKLFKNKVGRPSNQTIKMRRILYLIIILLIFFLVGITCYFIHAINTKKLEGKLTLSKNTLNEDIMSSSNEKVTIRQLALASGLSYMPIPASCVLVKNKLQKPCYFSDREIIVDKFNQFVNLHNYATAKDMDGWEIVDYTVQRTNKYSTYLDRLFQAYTLKKGNNVIILYRGTDFADLMEWIQHLTYASSNVHEQEGYAEKYILKQAKKYKDYNIYITGHSSGGYFAQIGASTLEKAILNGKSGSTDWDGWNINGVYDINDYLDSEGTFSEYKNINLVQAVGFNGMGPLFNAKTTDDVTVQDAKINILKNLGKNEYGESRLIHYNVRGDVVSSLGLQFGEIREIDAALDSVTYHRKNYKFLNKGNEALTKILAPSNNSSKLYKFSNNTNKVINLDYYLRNDVIANYNYYDMKSIVAYLNLTHEADEFACILDGSESPKVNIYEEKAWLLSTQINYITKKQDSVIVYNKNDNLNIRAMTTGACARKYTWYECSDSSGSNCNEIQVNSLKNENNSSTLSTNLKNGIKYYKVKSNYNDSYTLKELNIVDSKYKYTDKISEVKHIDEDIESDVVTVISDTESPKCSFNIGSFNNKVGCKKTVVLTCTDNVAIDKNKVKLSNFYGNLRNNVSLTINDNDKNNSINSFSINIDIKSKLITIGKDKLTVTISDLSGNKTTATLQGKINLFGKCN